MTPVSTAWHRPRKEPMTLDERKSGIYEDYRHDTDVVRLAAQEMGDNKECIAAMDDYLVLTVTTGLTDKATLEAAAKLQSMMTDKLKEWADSEAEDVHRKQQQEAA